MCFSDITDGNSPYYFGTNIERIYGGLVMEQKELRYHLEQLQEDLNKMSDEEIVEYRDVMQDRVRLCMSALEKIEIRLI